MTKKSSKSNGEVVIKGAAGVSTETEGNMSFFDKLKKKAEAPVVILDPETCTNKLMADHGEEMAIKYFNMYSTIYPADVGDKWRPSLLAIASKKSPNGTALENAGEGNLYFHESKAAVPSELLFSFGF